MTSGQSPSAARIGGIALIGVGALAAVIGTTTLVSGDSGDVAAPPPSESAAPLPPLPPQTHEQPRPDPAPPEPPPAAEPPEEPSPQPPAPPAEQPRPETPDSGKSPVLGVVRVYNNSTIKGLAHRAAEDFRSAGYEVPEVGNYARGTIPTTTVYYRPGTYEEQQARQIASAFQAKVEPRFPGLTDATSGVVAIITNDYKGIPSGKGGS